MSLTLFHTSYSRFQALEIIREHTFRDAVDDSSHLPFSYCRELADIAYEFYLKQSNAEIEIELARLTGEEPKVTD